GGEVGSLIGEFRGDAAPEVAARGGGESVRVEGEDRARSRGREGAEPAADDDRTRMVGECRRLARAGPGGWRDADDRHEVAEDDVERGEALVGGCRVFTEP